MILIIMHDTSIFIYKVLIQEIKCIIAFCDILLLATVVSIFVLKVSFL